MENLKPHKIFFNDYYFGKINNFNYYFFKALTTYALQSMKIVSLTMQSYSL